MHLEALGERKEGGRENELEEEEKEKEAKGS